MHQRKRSGFSSCYAKALFLSPVVKTMKRGLLLFSLIFCIGWAQAQEISISFPRKKVALNQNLPLIVEVKNGKVNRIEGFPNIPHFQRAGTSTSNNMQIINGQMSYTYKITQNYRPTKKGTFTIQPFTLIVDGKKVKSPKTTITVTDPVKRRRRRNPFAMDPFGFFKEQEEPDYVDVKADAFLALSVDKAEAYVGEEVHVSLSFYEALENRALLDFYNLQEQMTNLVNAIKPSNCWEENFQIIEIKRERVELKGKPYYRYKLFESSFFPMTNEDVVFPSLGLKMLKYKQARRMTFMQPNVKRDYKTFRTRRKVVRVKPLPEHPLKETVAVGQYKLEEELSDTLTQTGEGLTYTFKIKGRGNISQVPEPQQHHLPGLEVYPPSVFQNVQHNYGRVFGHKAFEYFIVPAAQGQVQLDEALSWVYFDPKRERYDTLRPSTQFEAKLNEAAKAGHFIDDPFYRIIGQEEGHTKLKRIGAAQESKRLAQYAFFALLISCMLGMIYLFWKRGQR